MMQLANRAAATVVVVVAVVGAVLLAGCTVEAAPAPAPTTTSTTPLRSPVATFAVPGRSTGEIARTVVTAASNSATAADLPHGTRRIVLQLQCSGPEGSTMHYQLLHANGDPFGAAGDWSCDRTPGRIEDGSITDTTGGVQIQVRTDLGVTTAWAVLTH